MSIENNVSYQNMFKLLSLVGESKYNASELKIDNIQAFDYISYANQLYSDNKMNKDFYLKVADGLKKVGEFYHNPEVIEIAESVHIVENKAKENTSNIGSYVFSMMKTSFSGLSKAASWTKENAEYYLFNSDQPWKQQKHEIAINTIIQGLKASYSEKEITEITQNKKGVKGSLQNGTAELLKELMAPGEDKRKKHKHFLLNLRTLLKSTEFQEGFKAKMNHQAYPKEVDILLEICNIRFTESHNYTFCESLIDGVADLGKEKLENSKEEEEPEDYSVEQKIDNQFESMAAAPQHVKTFWTKFYWSKLSGEYDINFDPHYQGNIPYVLFDVPVMDLKGNPKEVRIIRTGCPTIGYNPWQSEVNPEFRGFMQSTKAQGKKHLYVSLQKMHGAEKNRNETLKAFQKEFPDTFDFCVIAQDSNWYKQSLEFEKKNNAQEFKDNFLNQMLQDPHSGYYFPDQWKNDSVFTKGVKDLMEYIHQDVFAGKEELSLEERQDFIESYHAALQLFLIRYSQVDTVNITCKDAVDRAGKENTKLFDFITILLDQENRLDRQSESKTIMLTPSFFAKKRVMIKAKKKRLLQAKRRMNEPEALKNLKARSMIYGIDPKKADLHIQKHSDQKARIKVS